MSGLYNRDYSTLLSSEIEERERLEEKYSSAKLGHCVPFLEYPKAVRHNMSIFPNNYLDIAELQDKERIKEVCEKYNELLGNGSINELSIKRFIQDNRYYFIPASIFTRFSFGHHDAFLFKEFPLGTRYVADYLLIGRSSDGYSFVFVEFEHPYRNIKLQDGELGEAFRKGISQVTDWKRFLESHYNAISDELKKHSNPKNNMPDEMYTFDSSRMNYVVVAGKRSDFNENTYRIRREYKIDKNVSLLHYDNLYDYSLKLIKQGNY